MNQVALTQTFTSPLSSDNSRSESVSSRAENSHYESALQKVLATAALWHRRQVQRRQLSALNARQLNDMGISLEARAKEVAKAFWEK